MCLVETYYLDVWVEPQELKAEMVKVIGREGDCSFSLGDSFPPQS